jgi:hypothetical protein
MILFFWGSLCPGIRAEEIQTFEDRHTHLFQTPFEIEMVGPDEEEAENMGVSLSRMTVVKRLSRIRSIITRYPNRLSLERIARDHPEVRLLSLQVASQVVRYDVKFCLAHHAGALYHSLEYSFCRIFRCNGYFGAILRGFIFIFAPGSG